jgi:hypothetical protein
MYLLTAFIATLSLLPFVASHNVDSSKSLTKRTLNHCSIQKRNEFLKMVPQAYNAIQMESEAIFQRFPFAGDSGVGM